MAFSAPDGYCIEVSMNTRSSSHEERTYAEFNRNREEVAASFLSNCVATRDTRKIDECWLYDALLSRYRLHDTFGEAETVRQWTKTIR